jgi:hypothetical protein
MLVNGIIGFGISIGRNLGFGRSLINEEQKLTRRQFPTTDVTHDPVAVGYQVLMKFIAMLRIFSIGHFFMTEWTSLL